jgi:sortase B
MTKFRVIFFICAMLCVFSLYKVFSYFYESHQNNRLYTTIREEYVVQSEIEDERTVGNIQLEVSIEETDETIEIQTPVIREQFLPILELNNEVVGWITVPNTKVDYPVVKAADNEFYLHRNIEGQRSEAGTIFMDFRNSGDGNDRHTILYGHNMRDGSMFQGIMKYKDRDFFQKNAMIRFATLFAEEEWEVFSSYVTDTDFYYLVTSFRSKRDYLNFLNELKVRSSFDRDLELTEYDQILTLSTCSYEFEGARFVVHARKVKK